MPQGNINLSSGGGIFLRTKQLKDTVNVTPLMIDRLDKKVHEQKQWDQCPTDVHSVGGTIKLMLYRVAWKQIQTRSIRGDWNYKITFISG